MTDSSASARARQPKGIPVGGQFAATAHTEADLTLDGVGQHAGLRHWEPVAIDTELARLDGERGRHLTRADQAWDSLRHQARTYLGKSYRDTVTDAELNEVLHDVDDKPEAERNYTEQQIARTLDGYVNAREEAEKVEADMLPLELEFDRRGGWTRAFLVVTNGTGHVHSSRGCSTCYPTTRYHWVTEMSDHDEAEIVDAAGERACTVCYPSAPAETRAKPTRLFTPDEVEAAKAREERAAAKKQRDADRVAKALTADGSEAVFRYVWHTREDGTELTTTERFKTARAAEQFVVGAMADQVGYGYTIEPGKQEVIDQVVEMLAAKRDTDVETVRAEITTKAHAKVKRDARG
jgi:hypothetical protein